MGITYDCKNAPLRIEETSERLSVGIVKQCMARVVQHKPIYHTAPNMREVFIREMAEPFGIKIKD